MFTGVMVKPAWHSAIPQRGPIILEFCNSSLVQFLAIYGVECHPRPAISLHEKRMIERSNEKFAMI